MLVVADAAHCSHVPLAVQHTGSAFASANVTQPYTASPSYSSGSSHCSPDSLVMPVAGAGAAADIAGGADALDAAQGCFTQVVRFKYEREHMKE